MTEGARIPVGVAGVGSLGYHHARLLKGMPGVRLAGVSDANPERGREVASEFGTDLLALDDLLSRIEALVVAVPTIAHTEIALAAIARGVHVLIEKPLAPSIAEADQVLAAAHRAGVLVATGHVERFNPAIRACESLVDQPRFVESHRLAPFGPRGIDVAVVLDLMIHDIDLILGLVGRDVSSIDAVGIGVLTPNIDIANARLGFDGGAVANITASRVSRERMRKIRLFQESGYLSLDLAAGTGEFLRLRPGAVLSSEAAIAGGLAGLVQREELSGDGKEPLLAELESFIGAVRGESELVVTGHDGRRALEVALQIVERTQSNVSDPSSTRTA